MKDNETRDNCCYYNLGGDLDDPERPCYPREYGPRCEHAKAFFSFDGKSGPICATCKSFMTKEAIEDLIK